MTLHNQSRLMYRINQRRSNMDLEVYNCTKKCETEIKFEQCMHKEIDIFKVRVHNMYDQFYKKVLNPKPANQPEESNQA